jgi:hypothetical protein
MKRTFFYSTIVTLVFLMSMQNIHGQDTLPSFSVIERSGKIIIGWINPNPELKQIIIQRSFDSSKGFRSIISMPDPTAYTNGYLDKPADSATYFYRLFCTKAGGRYFFTQTKKAIKENQERFKCKFGLKCKHVKSETYEKVVNDKPIKCIIYKNTDKFCGCPRNHPKESLNNYIGRVSEGRRPTPPKTM